MPVKSEVDEYLITPQDGLMVEGEIEMVAESLTLKLTGSWSVAIIATLE